MNVGILALQGDVQEHAAAFAELGVATTPVLGPRELDGLDGIVLPGGESTTLSLLLETSGLFGPLADALGGGLPVFGTCAGMVLLATSVIDGRPDQKTFGLLDVTVRRNGYGRQLFSFEALVDAPGLDATDGPGSGARRDPLPAVFIRAPVVEVVGARVEVLATLAAQGDSGRAPDPVVVRQDQVLACAFHPELTDDRRLHSLFTDMVRAGPGARIGR